MGDSEAGRRPLVHGTAVAELAWVRFGAARPGEATPDGDLAEWTDPVWSTVGLPSQARWVRGPLDHRATPDDCMVRFACRAGADAMHVAMRVTGEVTKDRFTLYFDPRPPERLGTAGPYWWLGGSLHPDGRLQLRKGETTKEDVRIPGRWARTETGETICEFSVPHALMEATAWPESGDLGCSLVWDHVGPDGERTHLMWAEDGHPWNTRWYGVIRRTTAPATDLPYRVRVH